MQPSQPQKRGMKPIQRSAIFSRRISVRHTASEWEALPEMPKCELIDGEFVMFARPSIRHQLIYGSLYRKLYDLIHGGKCMVIQEPDVRINEDVYVPDIVVVCDPSKVKDSSIVGAPDLIVEILSPSTAVRDRSYKLGVYKSAGVREYWLVDPIRDSVSVYFFDESEYPLVYSCFSEIPVKITKTGSIDLREVFQ